MELSRQYFEFRGLRLSYLEGGPSTAPTIVFAHANGYAAGCYSYYLRRLAGEYHVVALDFSGHGNSESTHDFENWYFFRDQLLALIAHLRAPKIVGIGHSLGGACLLRTARIRPDLFDQIIALDPVILNVASVIYMKLFGNPLYKPASRRRNKFASPNLIRRAFGRFGWQEEVFEDYLNSCFRPAEGGLELCCSPQHEAKVFSQSDFASLWHYRRIRTRTRFLLPLAHQVCTPRAAARIAAGHPGSTVESLPGAEHLFPFINPVLTLSRISAALAD